MIIRDAKDFFAEYGVELSDGFDTMIRHKKVKAPGEGMQNDNYFHAMFFTDYMFRSTKHRLRILSGAQADGFLGILKTSLEGLLKNITKNCGFAHIILVDGSISPFLKSMKQKYPVLKTILVKTVRAENIRHTIVCDDYMVRDEKPHPQLTDDSNVEEIKATVYFNNKKRASVAADSFDQMWEILSENANA
jgi:hypothetical protein